MIFALAAMVCDAGAAIFQSVGAHRAPRFERLDPRLFLSLLRSGPYLAGIGLAAAAFGCSFLALRTTPLFVVQAVGAASIALVAVVSTRLHARPLRGRGWLAVVAVCVGIALLVTAYRPRRALVLGTLGEWSLFAAPVVAGGATVLARGRSAGTQGALSGLLAGLMFGDAAVTARLLSRDFALSVGLLRGPLPWALLLAGALGTLLYANALQRTTVTTATALSVTGQTLGPALTGWFFLGDDLRPGALWAAVAGFVLTVGGAVLLAGHAHPPAPTAHDAGPGSA